MDLESLKRNLRTDVIRTLYAESGCAGEERTPPSPAGASPPDAAAPAPSVLLLLEPRRLPRALVTDASGVVTPKILDYVDLLSTLDESAVVTELKKEPVRTLPLPELPHGALLVDLIERPSGCSYVVTGTCEAATHLFVLDEDGESTTHEIPLPPIVYRAVWHEQSQNVTGLALALCSPEQPSEPNAATELYRWPFSNVYHDFGGVLEGMCWPAKQTITLSPAEIPEKMVRQFVGLPNNADRYTRDLSHNAPATGYRAFLELIEKRGAMEHDWLEPCAMTIRDLHDQRRRKS